MSQVKVPRRFGDALLVDDLHVQIADVHELMEVAVAATDPLDAYLLSTSDTKLTAEARALKRQIKKALAEKPKAA